MNANAILQILQVIQGLLNFIATRGVARNEAIALLQKASDENRDVTTDEVQEQLNRTALELDETERVINENS